MTEDTRYERFKERYHSGDIPWDTGITPPEIYAIIGQLPPGTALDLGCGTGTNVITLAQNGWQAYGVDYVEKAISMARQKAEAAGVADRTAFQVGDARQVARFGFPLADLAVDIGCGHVFQAGGFPAYMRVVAAALKKGGTWMLYIHHHNQESGRGLAPEVVLKNAAPQFEVVTHTPSVDTTSGGASSWFRLWRTKATT
jgi:cyclopropane fatty-acyl-phospholipid synthase-like methyltransferase